MTRDVTSPPAPADALAFAEIERPFTLIEPRLYSVPVVVDVPHAGRRYPEAFAGRARLPLKSLRRSEDAFVDRLFAGAVELGAPLLLAEFPRAFVDVNREPYELDPRMFDGRLPPFVNTRSMRVAGGLGTVPRIVGDGHEIYTGKLRVEDALHRIERLYRPYHGALRGLVNATVARFGHCVLVDAHSMPSSSLERDGIARADVILGDRFGTSAAPFIVDIAEDALRECGFAVARNRPYAGGFITEHYGAPASRVHALQIEINRALYMNESELEPHEGFLAVEQTVRRTLALCFARWADILGDWREAAE